jgi:hypothetical protein
MTTASRAVRWYVIAGAAGWAALGIALWVWCPATTNAPTQIAHLTPLAVCQLKAMIVFVAFLLAMLLAGGLLFARMGRRARIFYLGAVLFPFTLAALRILQG